MPGSVAGREIWKFGVVAAAGATVVNVILLVAAKAAGVEFFSPDPRTGDPTEIGIVQVISLTLIPMLLGTAAAAIAERLNRPLRWVQIPVIVLTLLSLYAPLSLDAELSTKLSLTAMHLIAGGALVAALERVNRTRAPSSV
jgi:hypothetical protein